MRGVRLQLKPGGIGGTLHHPGEAGRRERRATLAQLISVLLVDSLYAQ
jgi:hypothetical protein